MAYVVDEEPQILCRGRTWNLRLPQQPQLQFQASDLQLSVRGASQFEFHVAPSLWAAGRVRDWLIQQRHEDNDLRTFLGPSGRPMSLNSVAPAFSLPFDVTGLLRLLLRVEVALVVSF